MARVGVVGAQYPDGVGEQVGAQVSSGRRFPGGAVTVTNTGSSPHDITVQGTDATTGEIAPGATATLDVR